MDTIHYWAKKHRNYAAENWINKPSLFAKFVTKYFPATGKVLELGAGQGQDSRFFSKLGYRVKSTDFSDEALRISEQNAKKEHVAVDLERVDLTKPLPYKEGEFSVVYAHLALHYFDHQTTQALFKEIYRVLQPGGIFAALFNTIEDPEIASGEKIEEGLYEVRGLIKRYFSLKYLLESISGKFMVIVADNNGKTYKDSVKTLIRFVGRKS